MKTRVKVTAWDGCGRKRDRQRWQWWVSQKKLLDPHIHQKDPHISNDYCLNDDLKYALNYSREEEIFIFENIVEKDPDVICSSSSFFSVSFALTFFSISNPGCMTDATRGGGNKTRMTRILDSFEVLPTSSSFLNIFNRIFLLSLSCKCVTTRFVLPKSFNHSVFSDYEQRLQGWWWTKDENQKQNKCVLKVTKISFRHQRFLHQSQSFSSWHFSSFPEKDTQIPSRGGLLEGLLKNSWQINLLLLKMLNFESWELKKPKSCSQNIKIFVSLQEIKERSVKSYIAQQETSFTPRERIM